MALSIDYYFDVAVALADALAGVGQFPAGSSLLLCDSAQFSQQDFLDLVDRLLPEEYLRPLKENPNAGYEIFRALASMAERMSKALHEVECGLVILYSSGPSLATVNVIFYRENTQAGAVTVKAGTLVTTSVGGRAFETTADAVFGGGDLEITVAARAIAPGYEYNVRGERVTAGVEVLPGEIDTIETMLQSPAFGDPSIKVKQAVDATGGYPDWLALHGDNRGLVQQQGESSDAFRLRIRSLPDTITPAALRRLAARTLGAIPWELVETWRASYVTCYDAPSANVGTPSYQAVLPTNPDFSTDLFCFDDPRSPKPYRDRILGPDDFRGAFIFAVDGDFTIADYGFALDDPGTLASTFNGSATGKRRGTPAFDLTGAAATTAALDGYDVAWDAAVSAFWFELQRAKAAGIIAVIDTYHTW